MKIGDKIPFAALNLLIDMNQSTLHDDGVNLYLSDYMTADGDVYRIYNLESDHQKLQDFLNNRISLLDIHNYCLDNHSIFHGIDKNLLFRDCIEIISNELVTEDIPSEFSYFRELVAG